MHDIKWLRANRDVLVGQLENRKVDGAASLVDNAVAYDDRRRELLFEVEELKGRRNAASAEVARLKKGNKAGKDAPEPGPTGGESPEETVARIIEETRALGQRISQLDEEGREVEEKLLQALLVIPNSYSDGVPVGGGEEDNRVLATVGEPTRPDFPARAHWELGEALGIIEFARAVKLSGSRFYALRGAGARLERALISFMLDLHTDHHGYEEIFPPFLVRSECMVGTAQLPKFGEEAYRIESDDLWLVPTAEVPLTNLHREEILDAGALPINYTAYTACFRRESGAAGRDTRGVIRVHQFNKVELVKLVEPSRSAEELERLRENAEAVLRTLELPYRIVELCTADLTFASAKTYDLEVWLPGQDTYREISSCSNFGSFQARRAGLRYRPAGEDGKPGKPEFVHTLNGSGLAVGRTMAAILENYQEEDGGVRIPTALRPYMGGMERIAPRA